MAQAAHVPIEEERLPMVRAQRLVDALAVQEAVIEDRNRRRRRVGDPAVHIDHRTHVATSILRGPPASARCIGSSTTM